MPDLIKSWEKILYWLKFWSNPPFTPLCNVMMGVENILLFCSNLPRFHQVSFQRTGNFERYRCIIWLRFKAGKDENAEWLYFILYYFLIRIIQMCLTPFLVKSHQHSARRSQTHHKEPNGKSLQREGSFPGKNWLETFSLAVEGRSREKHFRESVYVWL